MPLDTVQLPYVLSLGEVHAVEVGRAAGIKPPTWNENNKVNFLFYYLHEIEWNEIQQSDSTWIPLYITKRK